MASLGDPAAPVATREIEFALDRFEVEAGRLVVEGRWYGVLGRRFVRPVLTLAGRRRLIAAMEHKPWAAEEGAAWTAVFDAPGEIAPGRLQVAPDVAVELPAPGPGAGGERYPARIARPAVRRYEPAREEGDVDAPAEAPALIAPAPPDPELLAELEAARSEAATLRADLHAARAELTDAHTERERAQAESERLRAEADRARARTDTLESEAIDTRAEIDRLRGDVQRLQAAADQSLAERNRARDELERARVNANRTPYVAPRPMPFSDHPQRPDWRLRIAVGLLTLLLLAFFLGLIGAIL